MAFTVTQKIIKTHLDKGEMISESVEAVLKERKYLTCDLRGNTETREFAEVVIGKMRK